MSQNPIQKDKYLSSKLNEYHVTTPSFSRKTGKWSRFIDYLASPTKDPFECMITSSGASMFVSIGTILVPIILFVAQYFFFM